MPCAPGHALHELTINDRSEVLTLMVVSVSRNQGGAEGGGIRETESPSSAGVPPPNTRLALLQMGPSIDLKYACAPDVRPSDMHVTPKPRKLLVLDLDETLIHATESTLSHDEDFRVGPYRVHLRPHLADFLSSVLAQFKVGIWTASGESYASQVVERIFPNGALEFMWSSARCTTARDFTTGGYQTIKNLQKLKSKGYPLESIIAVDDTPAKYARSYGNLVTVREFLGDRSDAELPLLAAYLAHLAEAPNVRTVEKRAWREHARRMQASD